MTSIGLPVPPGMTITTDTCAAYYQHGSKMPSGLMDQVAKAIKTLEKETGKKFGDGRNPLLLSVRSGAAVSMPGMMDTVLNLGLNDDSVAAMAATESSLSPRLRTVSIMPGMETAAPERTESSNGLRPSPNFLPVSFSKVLMALAT